MTGGFLNWILFLPWQASTYARRVDQLHYFVILTTMTASTAIGLVALYFIVRYRRRPDQLATPTVESPAWMETLIVLGPLTLFLVWFTIGFRDYVWLKAPPPGSLDVYVTAKKWMWKFSYPGGPNDIGVLTVPARRPVRLLITSRDVIHSFFVPAFRIKQDALPGRYTQIWFEALEPGRHQVLCSEFCGTGHSEMLAEVVVLEPGAYDAWMARQRQGLVARIDAGKPGAPATLVEQGRQVAVDQGCLRCHTIDGTAHLGPTWKDLYLSEVPLEGGKTVVADEAYLTRSMMDPMADIVSGYLPIMPTYQGRLTGPESAALVEYIKSLSSRPAAEPASGAPVQ